jgi:hypothetical protein
MEQAYRNPFEKAYLNQNHKKTNCLLWHGCGLVVEENHQVMDGLNEIETTQKWT